MDESITLQDIRRDTEFDLLDAQSLAIRVFNKTSDPQPSASTTKLSQDLFVGVLLFITYTQDNGTQDDVMDYITDPRWDSALQMLLYFQFDDRPFRQIEAAKWRSRFLEQVADIDDESAEALVQQCRMQWKDVLRAPAQQIAQTVVKRQRSICIFDQVEVNAALGRISGIGTAKKTAGRLILENAQINQGHRAVPNSRTPVAALDKAAKNFGNLLEPIKRLQSRLALSSCMKPKDFYIPPMLLLGDPGIGKTFLAMQLSQILGVQMDKISAGGAQAGFQFTGSHASYNDARPGSIIKLLADGTSAMPVVVVDEVDKISTGNYPVLPVLLDLMEQETAKQFRDEFLDITFDASKIIFILTANSLANVPLPLLSRCEVFDIPRPLPQQRRLIIQGIADQLQRKIRKKIALDQSSCFMLSEQMDVDLRGVKRLVEDAYARAVQRKESVAYVWPSNLNFAAQENTDDHKTPRYLH
ncbi:ATP-dependent Lon protease [Oxalobacteraceae bacterium GrIS 1.18]